MQHLEVSGAVRRFFKSLGFKGLQIHQTNADECSHTLSKHHFINYEPTLIQHQIPSEN
jgi:protein involved in ribonucleotide reduction